MLQFIFLITLGLVSAAPKTITIENAWSVIPLPVNGSQCLYIAELRQFTCRGLKSEIITCDAERSLVNVPHKLFGLGRLPTVHGEEVKFGLFPKVVRPDNTTGYLDDRWELVNTTAETTVPLSFYHGDKFVDFGIRVADEKCYQRIVSFLGTIVGEQQVTLDTELEVDPAVGLIGEVFIVEPTQERRCLRCGFGGGMFGSLLLLSLLSPGFGFGMPFIG
jgi:hypothetical protein